LHYSGIEGFAFEPGFAYELNITVEQVENPPADASSERWVLNEIISQTRALEGNWWALESWANADGETVATLPGTEITAQFVDGQAGGSGGCNNYFGSYTLTGSAIQFAEVGSTMMFCDPQERMDQEIGYLEALRNVASYQITDDQLQLLNADGAVILTYSLLEPTPLADTIWVMTDYNNGQGGFVSALEDVEVTAVFDGEGQLAGSAGCNSYSGPYTLGTGTISIGQAVSTLMACIAPEGVMEQESAYLAALANVVSYEIRDDVLELKDAQGAIVAQYQAKAAITGVEWHWQSAQSQDGTTVTVPNPENYTLLLNDDGTLNLRADCNRGGGTYTLSGDQITITLGALTRAMCPPESLSQDYLAHLGAVTTLELVDESLVLSPGAAGETLTFAAG
jgi:heat shock protein HslJ